MEQAAGRAPRRGDGSPSGEVDAEGTSSEADIESSETETDTEVEAPLQEEGIQNLRFVVEDEQAVDGGLLALAELDGAFLGAVRRASTALAGRKHRSNLPTSRATPLPLRRQAFSQTTGIPPKSG